MTVAIKGEVLPFEAGVVDSMMEKRLAPLACVLLPEIQAFFESEEGQREFAEWKEKRYDQTPK